MKTRAVTKTAGVFQKVWVRKQISQSGQVSKIAQKAYKITSHVLGEERMEREARGMLGECHNWSAAVDYLPITG